jgi:hypothetical protein
MGDILRSINECHRIPDKIAEVRSPREKTEPKGVKPENRNTADPDIKD